MKLRTFNRTRFHLAIQQWFEQQFCHVFMLNNNNDMNKIPEYLLVNKSFPNVIWVNECEPILYKTDQSTIIMGCSLYKLPIEGCCLRNSEDKKRMSGALTESVDMEDPSCGVGKP
ncbi:unnamed protein product [Schistosoma mattheei]|uniref:Uncharacterized protein n=1 Tax=Schistosoma mattheei TaxID=31246 RepID=A0A3P7YSU9_9TREM|nr:unnamed protein product [Schistosoma mattheei]